MTLLAAVLMLAGSSLSLVAALGLIRLPDVFGRMHAATKPAVLGLLLLLGGAGVALGQGSATVRLVLAGALQLVTAPVAMHVVGRAVQRRLAVGGGVAVGGAVAGSEGDDIGVPAVEDPAVHATGAPAATEATGVARVEDDLA